mmetsp:Transcript_20849/g.57972  ORF Transcript_20849/g.57972 Transcript_20849/m.57972 type:complete len:101 (-) Transcript_20849:517-819(-)|eukprot:CAMPEP_0198126338 /NCGR_PEP_ID=MMETSP1442-20131203/44571_1 /TAXON_ID= /ORGANISM="Craspedostauros australis, Strain CCMP3328" /LENGTH=100 /DNA_ID=CAMNT_0043786101 /DNA_START=159 /DNA_END=461 /DNA_ORIENTATION=+
MQQEEQAKQLDSVTDRVTETELDASKAQEAMSALSTAKKEEDSKASAIAAMSISKDDVKLIVQEMEVTEELADQTLREVGVDLNTNDKLLEHALRRLVKS